MSETRFNIVFYGITQPGKDRDTVAQNMATLFKTSAEKIQPYFSGERRVIKGNLDELAAEKYRVALENAGLVINVEEATTPSASETPPAAPTESATDNPQSEANNIDTSDISVAEVGADVIEHRVEIPPQPIADISDISMAEVGADVLEHPVEVTPHAIEDISVHFTSSA